MVDFPSNIFIILMYIMIHRCVSTEHAYTQQSHLLYRLGRWWWVSKFVVPEWKHIMLFKLIRLCTCLHIIIYYILLYTHNVYMCTRACVLYVYSINVGNFTSLYFQALFSISFYSISFRSLSLSLRVRLSISSVYFIYLIVFSSSAS